MSEQAHPVGGPIMTRGFKALLAVFLVGAAMMIWRFVAGIGPVTGLSDGYPWGIWIAFDVVIGTALACGGYAVALLVYILNKGKYHALIRPAILTSALGYSLAGLAIVLDVGRYWNIFKLPIMPQWWNLNSVLLEVALCVMAYVVVLWIELSPAILERWSQSGRAGLARFAAGTRPIVEKALLPIVALGLLLPTMHQSSLGSVMLLAGPKLHALWSTPLLPLLFLVSCVSMGYGVVVMESMLSARSFRRRDETPMLASLAGPVALTLVLFAVLRLGDLVFRGALGAIFTSGIQTAWFLAEMALFIAPIFMFKSAAAARSKSGLFRAGFLVVLAGSLYRFGAYIVAYDPGPGWSYYPAVPELLITFGVLALEVMAYIVLVKRFPILAGAGPVPVSKTAAA